MALPKIAPLALLVAGVAVAVDQQQKAALQQVPNAAKEALDKANSLRNGDIGSALNQATSDMQGFASTVGNNVSGAIDTVSTKLGAGSISDFATDIGTGVNNAFGSAKDALGAVNKVSGGLSEISSTISKLGIGGDLASGFQNAAARLGAAAGVLNNLLSLKRGINLAKGGELFQTDAIW
jgi:methyl-accepting chemotaxis protein